ncbi:Transaldolase [Neochlamydia sp. EPS4]|nr:Transaldolase [Neochlamydia sp. EPS4]
MMSSQLEQLKQITTIVVDTGDIETIKKFTPTDATTNPSLILAATQQSQYKHLLDDAVQYAKKKAANSKEMRTLMMDKLFVNFGVEILRLVPGRVSTEVDARLSFDRDESIRRAHTLIKLYEEAGIKKERVLIKLASTWESTRAAQELENEGIHCNMTLLFSLPQAIACADVKATLISPFVGRILDWYKKNENASSYAPSEDPGVQSVTQIYNYLKKFGYKTQVMGASFRNVDEILELAGCDLLTIAPSLLEKLKNTQGPVPRKLNADQARHLNLEKINLDEKSFRLMLNDNAMATEKLAEGIRKFAEDLVKLEQYMADSYSLSF